VFYYLYFFLKYFSCYYFLIIIKRFLLFFLLFFFKFILVKSFGLIDRGFPSFGHRSKPGNYRGYELTSSAAIRKPGRQTFEIAQHPGSLRVPREWAPGHTSPHYLLRELVGPVHARPEKKIIGNMWSKPRGSPTGDLYNSTPIRVSEVPLERMSKVYAASLCGVRRATRQWRRARRRAPPRFGGGRKRSCFGRRQRR